MNAKIHHSPVSECDREELLFLLGGNKEALQLERSYGYAVGYADGQRDGRYWAAWCGFTAGLVLLPAVRWIAEQLI